MFFFLSLAGIARVISTTVNPSQETSVTCYIEGILPADVNDVNIYRLVDGSGYDVMGISRDEISSGDNEHGVSFIIDNVNQDDVFACSLKNGSSTVLEVFSVNTYGIWIHYFRSKYKSANM